MTSTHLGGVADGEPAAGPDRCGADDPVACATAAGAATFHDGSMLRRFLDHAPIAAWIADDRGRILARNAVVDGLQTRSLPARPTLWDILPPEVAQVCHDNNARVIATGQPCEDIEAAPRADGSPGLYRIYRFPFGEREGRSLIGGFAIDVTEQEQLRLANAQLAAIVRSTPAAIVSFDRERRVISWNEGATEMLGLATEEVVGRPLFARFEGDAASALAQALDDALAGSVQLRTQVRLPNHSGRALELDCSFSPLTADDGEIIGAAWIASDITEVRRLSERNRYLALREPQTGLLNEYGLLLSLDSELSMSPPMPLQLVLLQARRLPALKDVFGHAQAERLAQALVDRMHVQLPDDAGLLTRLGEDRFAWVMPHEAAAEPAMQDLLARVLRALMAPVELEPGIHFDLDLCAAHAAYPGDGADAETLLRHADLALSQARRQDAGTVLAFVPAMAVKVGRKMTIERRLAHALRDGGEQLHLAYQPIVDGEGRILGAEALSRWHCEELGNVPPDEFIPLAEETGLIHALGDRVVAQACRQLAMWQKSQPGLFLSINVSPIQLRQPGFAEQVENTLGEHGLSADSLVLEVTESALMDADGPEMRVLRRLGEHGLRLAIDDFGTGYSCLAHMKLLPLDKLKVDRRFVSGMVDNSRDRQIVDTLLTLGRSLDLTAIAEGVETELEFAALRELGCGLFQGYYFARPAPAAEFGRLLREGLPAAV